MDRKKSNSISTQKQIVLKKDSYSYPEQLIAAKLCENNWIIYEEKISEFNLRKTIECQC